MKPTFYSRFHFTRPNYQLLSLVLLSALVAGPPAFGQTGPGSALSFDGLDDVVSIGGSSISPPWTAEFWVNRDQAIDNSATLIGDNVSALKLEQFPNTRQVGYTLFDVADYSFNYVAPIGTWVHLAFVCSTNTKLYVNGQLQDSYAATIPLPLGQLGNDIPNRYANHLKGLVDEIRIWNVARGQTQIQSNMYQPLILPQTNLVAYWPLDEGAGNLIYDYAGKQSPGTLLNGLAWSTFIPPRVPTIYTLEPSEIASSSARMNGLVRCPGWPTSAWFEWGATTAYGNTTTPESFGPLGSYPYSGYSRFAWPLSGLSLGQTIHYRAMASDLGGVVAGTDEVLITAGLPRLSISLLQTNATISWSAETTGFTLETTTNVSGTSNWLAAEVYPQFLNGSNFVTLATTDTTRFFRLRQAAGAGSNFAGVPTYNLGMESPADPFGSGGAGAPNQGIVQVAEACPDCGAGASVPQAGDASGGGLAFLNNGEFLQTVTDLEIPGRGISWKMERRYRSGMNYDGPLGYRWEFNYDRRLEVQPNGDVLRMDGYGRTDRYVLGTNGFISPSGFFTRLTQLADGTYLERDRHGAKVLYATTNGPTTFQMSELRDRNGNRLQFHYNAAGQLSQVLDTLGRSIDYRYDAVTRRLVVIEDFSGRLIQYQYDANGDLTMVTSPAVTGTPNGNDFPSGKSRRYAYSTGYSDPRLNHQLVQVFAPNEVGSGGPPCVTATYETNTSSPDIGRLRQLTVGGVNSSAVPAGGTIYYQYQSLGTAATNDFNTAVFQTTVTDRNANQILYQFNQSGNVVRSRQYTRGLRAQEPAYYENRYEYNANGKVTRRTFPLGNYIDFVYDSANTNRLQQGNLLTETRYPDVSRGGNLAFIRTSWTYEPVYNQARTRTEPRGNDASYVPQNGGAASAARYTTTYTYDYQEGQDYATLAGELGISQSQAQSLLAGTPMSLGDVNGDGQTGQTHGNLIRTAEPTVTLLPGSNEAAVEGTTQQPIAWLFSYNLYGQEVSKRDAEGNVTTYAYNPENDPGSTGQGYTPGVSGGPFGYVHQLIVDAVSSAGRDSGANPAPAAITTIYGYDAVGNVTRVVDGRGIATDYSVNQLNQVVQTTRAAAHGLVSTGVAEPVPLTDFQYVTRAYYDANNNVVHREREDRGNTSNTSGYVDSYFQYDILDQLVQETAEVDVTSSLASRFRYDPNGNRTLVVQPLGNAAAKRFDERNLLFQTTVGATNATPGTLGAFPVGGARGGTPATASVNYDANGNIAEVVDAADTDASAANNSSIAGAGDVTRNTYDGYDRVVGVINAVGSKASFAYDPAGHRIANTNAGPIGGSSPTDMLGANNVNLSILMSSYDELGRLFQEDTQLFVPAGAPAQRSPNVTEGPLTPGDGKVTARIEYDRNSRRTFVVSDDLKTTRTYYDGADRIINSRDGLGNGMENTYDGNGNLIETRQTDVCQVVGVANEVFITTYFYDSLNRLQRQVDNLGQTTEYRYDSRGNLVASADANGPVNGSINRRSFSPGPSTVNSINGFGNVNLFTYDGLGRKTREDRVMTASGKGDGINIGADIFGVKTSPPTPDTTQAGGDGLITVRYQWDGNSLLTSLTDDNGNQTAYTYDNLNRGLSETKGICSPPFLANMCAAPTTATVQYDQDGNPVTIIDENGSVSSNRFDAVNRLISRQITRGSNVVGTTLETYLYDGLSRLVRATDNNEPADTNDDSVVTFAYDSLGRRIEETQQIGAETPKAVSSSWSASRLRTSLTYPNGRVITNTFDALDRLSSIGDYGAPQPVATYKYIGRSRVAERQYPINGTRMSFLNSSNTADLGYDGLRRPVQVSHLRGTTNLVSFGNGYDRANNALFDKKLHATNDSELYGYDSGYRLLNFARGTLNSGGNAISIPSAHAAGQTNWVLDGVGNWKRVNQETRLHDSFNEITVRSNLTITAIVSDANGNETDNGTNTFRYDYRNRLRTVTRKSDSALIAIYAYDYGNRRISKMVTNSGALNGTTRFYLSDWREIEERNGTNGLAQQYVYGNATDALLVMDRNWDGDGSATGTNDQRLFYHQNKQYSVFALTDSTGRVVEGYQYDAYGAHTLFEPGANGVVEFGGDDTIYAGARSPLGNTYLYAGRRFEPETGLIYFRNRYLSPSEGRFLSRDPLGFAAGSAALHEFAQGNGINASDPLGTEPVPLGPEYYGPGAYRGPSDNGLKSEFDVILFLASLGASGAAGELYDFGESVLSFGKSFYDGIATGSGEAFLQAIIEKKTDDWTCDLVDYLTNGDDEKRRPGSTGSKNDSAGSSSGSSSSTKSSSSTPSGNNNSSGKSGQSPRSEVDDSKPPKSEEPKAVMLVCDEGSNFENCKEYNTPAPDGGGEDGNCGSPVPVGNCKVPMDVLLGKGPPNLDNSEGCGNGIPFRVGSFQGGGSGGADPSECGNGGRMFIGRCGFTGGRIDDPELNGLHNPYAYSAAKGIIGRRIAGSAVGGVAR